MLLLGKTEEKHPGDGTRPAPSTTKTLIEGCTNHFSRNVLSCDPLTLTFKHNVDSLMMNQRAKYVDQTSFGSKFTIQTHTARPTALPRPLKWSVKSIIIHTCR